MHEIWEALLQGVPFSFINILVFGFAIAIILERFYFLSTRYKVNSEEFMAQVKKLVQAGNVDRAVKLCEAAPLPLLEVVHAGLTRLNRSDEVAIAAMEEKMGEVLPALEKRTPMLWTLANIATLIGLLGTIRGLIRAFGAVGSISDPAQKTAYLSAGISEAMWNTFLGLLIAVVCMVFHLIINNMTKNNKHDLERAVMQLENLLTLRRSGG
jgi:biopolymer transport protein ExbB